MSADKLAQAIEFRKDKQYAEAQEIFAELLAATPDDPRVNFHFAWWHDAQGLEAGAVPYYEKAIANGLSGDDLRGALLGLGSTYRCLGRYDESVNTLRRGMSEFPSAGEFPVFLAMALYNTGDHHEAMTLLLKSLLETTASADILGYKNALDFYHDKLDEIWK